MCGQSIGVTNHDTGQDDQDRHQHCPHESHDRLLVTDFDVTADNHVEQFAIFVQLSQFFMDFSRLLVVLPAYRLYRTPFQVFLDAFVQRLAIYYQGLMHRFAVRSMSASLCEKLTTNDGAITPSPDQFLHEQCAESLRTLVILITRAKYKIARPPDNLKKTFEPILSDRPLEQRLQLLLLFSTGIQSRCVRDMSEWSQASPPRHVSRHHEWSKAEIRAADHVPNRPVA